MTASSGLYIAPNEQDRLRQNQAIAQLMAGRSNAVGAVTMTGNGVATTKTVTAPNCGAGSAVFLFPQTAHAAAVVASTYVPVATITAGQFIVNHAVTSESDVTFCWVCLG